MKKVFIINGGQTFAHYGGRFNQTLTNWTIDFFKKQGDFQIKTTNINDPYVADTEVEKFVWADIIIYHTPVWWFQLPGKFKQYIDEVFTAGYQKGIYKNDGRSHTNPAINYGTGGMLHGRTYLLTTSWNAPATAFTLPDEFFQETDVDNGVMFGFHRMNTFTGMAKLPGFHFHDMEKNVTDERIEQYRQVYLSHLTEIFLQVAVS